MTADHLHTRTMNNATTTAEQITVHTMTIRALESEVIQAPEGSRKRQELQTWLDRQCELLAGLVEDC